MDIKITDAGSALKNIAGSAGSNAGSGGGAGFASMVAKTLDDSSSTIHRAESLNSASLVNDVSLEELTTAVSNAEITLKAVVAIRDRIISAYQDIIKMPI